MKPIFACLAILLTLGHISARAQSCYPELMHDSTQFVTDGSIDATALFGDTLYAGGSFSYVGRYTGGFARISQGGNLLMDGKWPRVNGTVYSLLPDGKGGVYIGGDFTRVGDSVRNGVAQIDSGGTLTPFRMQLYAIPTSLDTIKVYSLAKTRDKLIVGGRFGTSGTATNLCAYSIPGDSMIRWDVRPELPGSAPGSTIRTLCIVHDTLYAGGYFSSMQVRGSITANMRSNLAAFDTSLNLAAWNPGANGPVRALAANNSTLFAAGSFTVIAGRSRSGLAAFDPGSGGIGSWNPVIGNDAAGRGIEALAATQSHLYIAGNFRTVNSTNRPFAAALDPVTATTLSWNPAPDTTVCSIFPGQAGVFLGGHFNALGSAVRRQLGLVDSITGAAASWTAHASGTASGSGGVFAIAEQNGAVQAGGGFTSACGILRPYLTSFRLSDHSIIIPAIRVNGPVYTMHRFDRKLYLGGAFDSVNIFRTPWLAVIEPSTYTIHPPLIQSGGGPVTGIGDDSTDLFISGRFTTINGSPRGYGAGFRMQNDSMTGWNPGLNAEAYAVLPVNNTVFLAGAFDRIGTATRNRVGAVDKAGGAARNWNPGFSPMPAAVYNLQHRGRRIYVGGLFAVDTASAIAFPPYYWAGMPGSQTVALYDATSISSHPGWMYTSDTAVNAPWKLWTRHQDSTFRGMRFIPTAGILAHGAVRSTSSRGFGTICRLQISSPRITPTLSIAGPDTICIKNRLYTWTAKTNVPSGIYQWRRTGVLGWQPFSTFNQTSEIPNTWMTPGFRDTLFVRMIVTGGCVTQDTLYAERPLYYKGTTTMTASIAGNQSVCAGSTNVYTARTNASNPTYQWYQSWPGISNRTGSNADTLHHNFTGFSSDLFLEITAPDSACFNNSPLITTAYRVSVAPHATLTAGIVYDYNRIICTGDTLSLSATTNGGQPAHYQWFHNGLAAGGDSSSVLLSPLNNDTVSVLVHDPAQGCYTGDSAYSAPVTLQVYQPGSASISIQIPVSAPDGAVVTVVASVNAGTRYTIDWFRNGNPAGQTTTPLFSFVMGVAPETISATVNTTTSCYQRASSGPQTIINGPWVGIASASAGGSIAVLPNPFKQELQFRNLHAGDVITLYDARGSRLFVQNVGQSSSQMTRLIPELPAATYFLRITDSRGHLRWAGPLRRE